MNTKLCASVLVIGIITASVLLMDTASSEARLTAEQKQKTQGTAGWKTFSIPQSGTRVDYPATIFSVSEGEAENGTGERFRASDARASFSVYSMANEAGETPAAYLRNNLRRPRSALQHEQVTSSFFTISEETKDAVYYSRCNFSNDGRIHCFDLIYPLQEKRAWGSVVTRISGSLRPIGSARLAVGHTPEGTDTMRWTSLSISQSGTRVDYPATIFSVSEGEAENGTGERFRASDARASFSVYSMANEAGETPAAYLRNNLRRPALQHEQVTSSFFTISEETKDAVYYSRCNFSNDGRIHCFDLIYPLQEKRAWGSVVTRISGSLRPIGSARLAVGHTPEGRDTMRWTSLSISQSGTRVDYPATIFSVSEGEAENGTGERFRASDARASFSVYSMANEAGETPAAYLRNNLRRPRSALQHEQVTSSFFTISEETKDAVYYSRCNFSNDGRIHCFDLIYPLQEKRAWDSVVTRISGSLRPIGSARLAVGHTPEGRDTMRWTSLSISQSGTRVDYPATIFSVSEGEAENGTGERFRASDARASFSVYSMANEAGETPAAYLRNNLRRPRSALQHEQVTSSFFTISEETKDAVYYSRCNFSNDGRIHCFDLIYPLQEKRAWDSVVTRISGSLRPIGSARLAVRHTPEGTKSSPSDHTISDEKRDMKTRDMKKPVRPRMVATTSDEKHHMKMRDMKKPVRPRMVAKRQATNYTPGKQVPLENRNTSACSDFQTCLGRVPPLFGVGF